MVVLEFFYRTFQGNPLQRFLLNSVRTTLGNAKSCHRKLILLWKCTIIWFALD
jgi:hypothetical protein